MMVRQEALLCSHALWSGNYVIPQCLSHSLFILRRSAYLQVFTRFKKSKILSPFSIFFLKKVPVKPFCPFPPLYCEVLVPTSSGFIVSGLFLAPLILKGQGLHGAPASSSSRDWEAWLHMCIRTSCGVCETILKLGPQPRLTKSESLLGGGQSKSFPGHSVELRPAHLLAYAEAEGTEAVCG